MTRRALVLSGGGARGAYEAGVLSLMLERAAMLRRPWVDFVCGTSVGAVTGALIAATLDRPAESARELVRLWSELAIEDVLAFGLPQVSGLPRLVFGGRRSAGLFDGRALAVMVGRHIPWTRIREHIDSGLLGALTITATHVPTGRPTVFVERGAGVVLPANIGRRVVVRDAQIGAPQVLASAAIPLLFPPVRVGSDLYCDGGLRLNTPLGPAIRLGAREVFAIGLATAHEEPPVPSDRYPSASFLMGKVLNAFLLDHIMSDLDELERINRFLADGATVAGPGFEGQLAAVAAARGTPAYHPVKAHVVRPSHDLGAIAADHLRRMRGRLGRLSVARGLLRFLDTGEGSDIASYLLFDRAYAADLIALGRRDAQEHLSAIDAFLEAPG